jgi:hypothetical protein
MLHEGVELGSRMTEMLERAAFSSVVACGYPDEIEPRSVMTIKIERKDRKQADGVDSGLRARQDFSLGLLAGSACACTHFAPERRARSRNLRLRPRSSEVGGLESSGFGEVVASAGT